MLYPYVCFSANTFGPKKTLLSFRYDFGGTSIIDMYG